MLHDQGRRLGLVAIPVDGPPRSPPTKAGAVRGARGRRAPRSPLRKPLRMTPHLRRRRDARKGLVLGVVLSKDVDPIGHRFARAGLAPPGRGWHDRTEFELLQITFVDYVLRADLVCVELPFADPAAHSLRIAAEPTSGLRDGQHCCNILQQPARRGSPVGILRRRSAARARKDGCLAVLRSLVVPRRSATLGPWPLFASPSPRHR